LIYPDTGTADTQIPGCLGPMKRKLLVALVIVAAGALLLPTLASPLDEETDVDLHDDIEMAPSDGPNGVYATLDDDEKIAIEITEERQEAAEWEGGSGVSDDSETQIDKIFDIIYTGEEESRVWLDKTEEGITFYTGDNPENSIEGESNNVSLEEGEVVSVGLFIDTTVDDHEVEEVSDFGVNAEVAEPDGDSTLTLTDGEIHPIFESVAVNESGVNATATAENIGHTIAEDTVSLSVDGEEIANESTTELTGGSSERIQFDEALSLPAGENVKLQLETSNGSEVMTTEVTPDELDKEPDDDGTENETKEDEADDEEEEDDEGIDEDTTDTETAEDTETGADDDSTEDDETGSDTPSSPLQDNPFTETLSESPTLTALLLLAGTGAGVVAAVAVRRKLSSG